MSRRYFTSDLHFGHVNIIEYAGRPFVDTTHMNEALVQNWNSVVNPDDEVYIVGDFAMGRLEETLPYAGRLNGRKTLVLGNHDRPWRGNSPAQRTRWGPEYAKYFDLVEGPVTFELRSGRVVLLSHFPRSDVQRHGGRFSPYLPPNNDLWVVHGHTHSRVPGNPARREVHVGVDAWDYCPVREDWVEGYIEAGTPPG